MNFPSVFGPCAITQARFDLMARELVKRHARLSIEEAEILLRGVLVAGEIQVIRPYTDGP